MVNPPDTPLDAGVITSVVLPLPVKHCWPYLREPALIREWHGWEDAGLDAEVQEIFVDGAKVSEDHRMLSLGTHLFILTEEDAHTRVDVHRAPLPEDSEDTQFLPDIDEGWTSFLQQLRFKLTRHQDARGQTRFYSGAPLDPTIPPVQLLGLGQVVSQAVGAEYDTTVAPVQALTGSLWFVSQHQVGVTVDAWGDGLLIVTNGPRGGPPYTSGQAMLTSYGLDATERQDLADRWDAWWAEHFHDA